MAGKGKKKKRILFAIEIIVLLLFIGGQKAEKWKKALYLKKEYDTLILEMKHTVRCVGIERGYGKDEEP